MDGYRTLGCGISRGKRVWEDGRKVGRDEICCAEREFEVIKLGSGHAEGGTEAEEE